MKQCLPSSAVGNTRKCAERFFVIFFPGCVFIEVSFLFIFSHCVCFLKPVQPSLLAVYPAC